VSLFDETDVGEDSGDDGPFAAPPLDPGTVRLRMTLAYDGTYFRGFWPNDGVRTVGDTVEHALQQVLGHPVRLTCAGRTDAGVHAHGQVVSFAAAEENLDLVRVQQAVNSICGPEIAALDIQVAGAGFDARASATARCYRYTILNREAPDPFLSATAWHVIAPLDLRTMRLASDPLIGEHDFSSFCRRPKRSPDLSLKRRVIETAWHDLGDDLLRLDIEASAFCHQMVRSIVGTLVEVGRGKKRAGDMTGIIRARDRTAAGDIAPPHGLTLWNVKYQ
jgi:tRNA pseudouridine38-40 synthase